MQLAKRNSYSRILALLLFLFTTAPGSSWVHFAASCADPSQHAHCFWSHHSPSSNDDTALDAHGPCCVHSHPSSLSSDSELANKAESLETSGDGNGSKKSEPLPRICLEADGHLRNSNSDDDSESICCGTPGQTESHSPACDVTNDRSNPPCSLHATADEHESTSIQSADHFHGVEDVCSICSLFAKALGIHLPSVHVITILVVEHLSSLCGGDVQPVAIRLSARGPPIL